MDEGKEGEKELKIKWTEGEGIKFLLCYFRAAVALAEIA